jgi:hypothetical protein
MTFQERVLPIDHFELFNFPSIKELILEWQKQGLKYVRIVINDSVTNNIIYISGLSFDENQSLKPTFSDLYDLLKIKDEITITMLMSLYNKISADLLLNMLNTQIKSKDKYIDELLKESNGYLIYHHQLEKFVIDKIKVNKKDAIVIRRNWNKKVVKVREKLIQADDYYLIENKMPQYFVFEKSKLFI